MTTWAYAIFDVKIYYKRSLEKIYYDMIQQLCKNSNFHQELRFPVHNCRNMKNLWRNITYIVWHMWKDITHYLTFLSRQSFSCILQMDVTLLQGKEESIKISLQVFTTIKTRKYFYLFINNLLHVLIIFL